MAKKVLLIDYEPRSVERVRTLLPSPEYAVSVAKDGEEGLTLAGASSFDLIVLGGMLPRLPSAEVIREIRRKGGATAPPILLVVSGYHGSNPKADAQRVGAFDIVVRPYTDEDFLGAVRSALDSGEAGARTMRIPVSDIAAAQPALTSDDIFSDVLEDVASERSFSEVTPPRAVMPPMTAEEQIEKRLRETLSGMVDRASTRRPIAPPPPPPPLAFSGGAAPAVPRFSTDADIDRMISDTLSGLKTPPARPRPSPDAAPEFGIQVETPPPAFAPPVLRASPPPSPAAPPSAPPRSSQPHPVSSSGPDQFGRYELLEKIASGGMAELSKARRSGVEGFQKIVAIKKILPHLADNDEFITMFADEAKLAAQLNHPNIVHIFDLGKIEAGGYFIAMEFVDGRDLRSLLQSARDFGTPLPVPLAVYIASKIAAALDYAHRRRDGEGRELNVVHRDVSPPNILISYEGDIKLCDFGIAKAASKASQTQSGALKGKVQYMSPEQAWGRPIDRRSDIFSLGCVLFEMLAEQKLFRGDTDLSVLEKVRAAQVVAPSTLNPEVPKALDAIVLKALAREPEERYGIASDMLRDLEGVLYSYTPAPGSADLAIYLHRLQAEESARQESLDREASRGAPPEPERKRKSKGAPVVRRTGSTPKLVVPPHTLEAEAGASVPSEKKEPRNSGVFGSFSPKKLESERKSRVPLYAMIVIAALLLAGLAVWLTRRPSAAAPVAIMPTAVPAAAPTAAPLPAAVTPASGVDPKAIEEEVQRQLAARRKELQKTLASQKPAKETAPAAPVPAPKKVEGAPAAAPRVTVHEPAPEPARQQEPAPRESPPEPTAVPPPPARAEAKEEISRGDLVGPGAGVVEPSLLSTPRVTYPAIARQQRLNGKVVVLVLVTEDGQVSEARLQQGLPSRSGVNEAVVDAVRAAKFRAATKNGVAVKMWRTVVVDVRP
ncbi:MAG: TonB family protein [Acidobacteria bacterium]|nr:TonB family protein [Acidobacteriota bacterium]